MRKSLLVLSATVTVVGLFSAPMLLAQNSSPYWSLAGNSNAAPSSKLGTTGDVSLRFYTKNVQRMIINSVAGLVGIGTASPNSKLHVNSVAGENPFRAQVNGLTKLLMHSNGGVSIGGFLTPPANGLYVSGNAGIGTATPFAKLHVVTGGTAIYGNSTGSGYGVNGSSTYIGVIGFGGDYGVYGAGDIGVYGRTDNSSYAGYFSGKVYSTAGYTSSDRKLKQDIADVTNAMDIILKLQPKTYKFRQDGNYKLMNLPVGKHYGLIAQDVEAILPNLVNDTKFDTKMAQPDEGIAEPSQARAVETKPTSYETIEFKALNYTELIPIVISGMKELDDENKVLKQELAELRQMVLDLKKDRSGTNTITSAFLEQNNPNPVSGNTMIRYQVPATATSARVTITNIKGQLIKAVIIGNMGAGQVNFNSATLPAGTYNYSLWVDGKQVDTKRLIIAR